MNHPDLISGGWTGFYNYEAGGHRYRTDLVLSFTSGIIVGQGSDQIGVFGIAGCYDYERGEIQWTKTYYGAHAVRYRGFVDGCSIWGTWKIGEIAKGGFHIWPFEFDARVAESQQRDKAPATLRLPARKRQRLY